jgi:hypothetical protein
VGNPDGWRIGVVQTNDKLSSGHGIGRPTECCDNIEITCGVAVGAQGVVAPLVAGAAAQNANLI